MDYTHSGAISILEVCVNRRIVLIALVTVGCSYMAEVKGGYNSIPSGPAWGCDLYEEARIRYSYEG